MAKIGWALFTLSGVLRFSIVTIIVLSSALLFQPETNGATRLTSSWAPEGVPQSEVGWSEAGKGEYDVSLGAEYVDEGQTESDFWESDYEGWRLKDGRYIP